MLDAISADAPGRVNLIGEHTDYHDGYVLPTIIPQRTRILLRPRSDRTVRATSGTLDGGWLEYECGKEAPGRGWLDYLQGVTATLARRGVDVPGFDARIESSIPIGAGVSSSAALEISLLRALRQLMHLPIDDVELARIGQTAEREFVGVPVGILDQMASSLGRDDEALFIDTRSLAIERLPIAKSMDIVVIHSGVTHSHAGGEYSTRRRESFEAAALLGVKTLRDVDAGRLAEIERLPPPLSRRARHIVTENARVLAAADALRRADAAALGALFSQSHASMRDDYETSTPEIDTMVHIGESHPDIYGARLTGGGFGGAVVMIAKGGRGGSSSRAIADAYEDATGRTALVLMPSS